MSPSSKRDNGALRSGGSAGQQIAAISAGALFLVLLEVVPALAQEALKGAEGYRANVRTFIKRIRKKFRDLDPDFDQIHNYAGFGYRWIAGP